MNESKTSMLTPMQIVAIARHAERPTTSDYIEKMLTNFVELHGDRNFADDPAIMGGAAELVGMPVMIIGHQRGKTTKENIFRNFAMANPEGYRKALRLMKLAERYNRPVITLVDTKGAYPGIGAEERGQAEAIARNLREMGGLKVPIITVVTGEGGSGGALGIGMGNRVLMMQYSIYSVISPEGCASILFRDAKRSQEAAENMRITALDLKALGVIEEIIPEPEGGAHNNYDLAAANVKTSILKHLKDFERMSGDRIAEQRYDRYRKMGFFEEGII